MGWVAARLRAGPIPTLRSLWHGPSLRRTEGGRRERCERPCGAQGSVSPVGCCAKRKATRSAPKGSVSPVGCCAKRKATRRREQIQGLRAASAQNADICEGSETMSATVREARMIEQPGARNAACGRQRRIPQELCSPRPVRSSAACARAHRSRRAPAPAPQPTPRKRFERPCGARNAPPRTPRRISPGLSPAPSLRGLESRSSPS